MIRNVRRRERMEGKTFEVYVLTFLIFLLQDNSTQTQANQTQTPKSAFAMIMEANGIQGKSRGE